MQFLEKLAEIEKKYEELTAQLGDAEVLADPSRYQKAAKALAELSEIVEKYRQWKEIRKALADTKALIEESSSDPALKALAQEELAEFENRQEAADAGLVVLFLPKGPNGATRVGL